MWITLAKDIEPDFLARYRTTYKSEPAPSSLNGYDIVWLIARAIEQNGYTADGVKNFLARVRDYQGISQTITFNQQGYLANKEYFVRVVKNGEIKNIDE